MTRENKVKLIRKYRTNIWLTFSMIAYFVLGFVFILVFRMELPVVTRFIIGGTVIASPFLGLIFNVRADWTHRDLIKEKLNIRNYRTRKNFLRCLDTIEAGDLKKAVDIYSDFIPQGTMRDYLYGILIYQLKHSQDPGLQEIGEKRMKDLREHYDPNKVEFYDPDKVQF